MIKIINFGLQSPNSSMTIIKRGGKKIVLAFVIEIEASLDSFGDITPEILVTFGLEEVPFSAAKKLFSQNEAAEDTGVLVALADGRQVTDEADLAMLREYVRRYVMALPVVELKLH